MKWYERTRTVEFIVFGAMLAGVSLSAMLWISDRVYPLTPLFHSALIIPPPFDALLVISLVALGILSLILPKDPRPLLGFLIHLGALLILDQSRWQPWVFIYLFFFFGFYLIRRRNNEARAESIQQVFRLILIGVYAWSAIQKFNVSFITEVASGILAPIPIIGPLIAGSLFAILLMPVAELAISMGLYFERTRKAAVILAIIMHGLILLSIGPFGQNWNTVVWPWNIAMILLVFSLFWNAKEPISLTSIMKSKHPFVLSVIAFFFILPALSFSGFWDSYLSFALYSGNVKNAYLIMRPEHLKIFPESVWQYADRQRDGSVKLRPFHWSMEVMNVPRYPEERIFRSTLAWVCKKTGDEIHLEIYGRPHWITKERGVKKLSCEDL